MDNPYPPLAFLGSELSMKFGAGVQNADDIYAAVSHRVRIVEAIKGSEGELVSQLAALLRRYDRLATYVSRTRDSITIGIALLPF